MFECDFKWFFNDDMFFGVSCFDCWFEMGIVGGINGYDGNVGIG